MDTKRWHRSKAVCAALVGTWIAVAAAQAEPPHAFPTLEQRVAALHLDSKTEDAVDAVLDRLEPELRASMRDASRARRRLHELLADPAAEAEAIRARAQALSQLEQRVDIQRIGMLLEIRALVPAEKRAALAPPAGPPPGRGPGRGEREVRERPLRP